MPYASQRDRLPPNLELEKTPWPVPPLNLFLVGGVNTGVFDLQWDDPSQLSLNSSFGIVGVNIYRAFDSEYGPFERLTTLPVGSMFWRDQTDNVLIPDEDVSDRFILRGTSQDAGELYNGRFVFRTQRCPIVKAGSQAINADSPSDVMVFVDGVRANVLSVHGWSGEVELDNQMHPEVGTQTRMVPVLPGPNSVVTCSYRYNRSLLQQSLAQRVFYRVTTVATPANGVDLVETPLERAAATSSYEVEKLDWIWREAIRRNRWILTQGGERVKLFLHRHNGVACPCIANPQYKQPINDCTICYGTGSIGGFDGPYDALIAPDDAEKKIAQQAVGRVWEHTYEVWTGPTPLLTQRDFLVKVNGERYSIGGVRIPSNRGMLLQQHFNIGAMDLKDIRNSVPIDGNSDRYTVRQLPAMLPDDPVMGTTSPPAGITSKPGIPDERELRGRTVVWENIVY
jgi:hypothetical protein